MRCLGIVSKQHSTNTDIYHSGWGVWVDQYLTFLEIFQKADFREQLCSPKRLNVPGGKHEVSYASSSLSSFLFCTGSFRKCSLVPTKFRNPVVGMHDTIGKSPDPALKELLASRAVITQGSKQHKRQRPGLSCSSLCC